MRSPLSLTTLIACLLLLALPAAAAQANASDEQIVRDCQHSATGALSGSYSKSQLRHALNNLPGDVAEYTGCYDAIRQAMTTGGRGRDGDGSSGGGTGGSGGGGALGGSGSDGGSGGANGGGGGNVPVANARPPAGAEKPVQVAGAAVAPGELPEIGLDSHQLPTPLLVLLILLGVAALAAAALTIGRRVVARRRT